MKFRDLFRPAGFIVTLLCFCLSTIIVGAWSRSSPLRTSKAEGVNIEKVATTYSVVALGPTSVFVPMDEGGTGQRFMADTWALYVHAPSGTNGQKVELYRAWGEDAVVWLERKRDALMAANCSDLFGFPGYSAVEPCPTP